MKNDLLNLHIGLEIISSSNTTFVEGNELTLTCLIKNKENAELSWRWIPFDPEYGMRDKSIEIKENQLPAGFSFILSKLTNVLYI